MLQWVFRKMDQYPTPGFLKVGSAKGESGVPKNEMRNGGRVLSASLNLRSRTEVRVATFYTNHSVADSTQASIQKLPDSVAKSVSTARRKRSMFQAKRSGYRSV